MATLVINKSGGILPLDSLKVVILPGCRKEFANTYDQLIAMAPELHILERRGHVIISEDAILVKDDHVAQPPVVEPPVVEPPVVEPPVVVHPVEPPAEPASVAPVVVPEEPVVDDAEAKKNKKHKAKKLEE